MGMSGDFEEGVRVFVSRDKICFYAFSLTVIFVPGQSLFVMPADRNGQYLRENWNNHIRTKGLPQQKGVISEHSIPETSL